MKRRAPGSQVVAQTVWMLSLQNPKLGACKFAPVLVGIGGSASGEVWGWDLALLSLCMMGTESAGLAGMLPKQGLLFLGGSSLSWVSHAPRARSQAVSCCHHHRGRLGFHTLPGEVLLPHRPYLLSLCSFGLWYQGSSKDPPTSSCSGTWEIIDSLDTQLEPEGEIEAGPSSPDRAMAAL